MADRKVLGAVLCAGFGTRMRPFTEVLPKPLLPFLNTPIITYSLNQLAQANVDMVGVNLHHLADTIPPVVDRLAGAFGLKLRYAREWEILGTAGGIRGIWQALDESEGTLIVMNGDSVMDIDLHEQLEAHRESGRDVTLLTRIKDPDQPGKVFVDGDHQLTRIRDYKSQSHGDSDVEMDFLGVHFIETHVLNELEVEPGDIIDELYGPMVEAGASIGVSVAERFWAALDNPFLLMETSERVLEHPEIFPLAPLPEPLDDGLYVYGDQIGDKVELAAPVFLGMNVAIEDGAKVGPNVIMDGVSLKAGAVARNAILYGMGELEGEWTDCVAIAGKVVQIA